MKTAPIAQKGTFTGWHMLAIVVTFFAVIISVNVFMAFSAISTWTGLVVENSYVASQQFNGKLAVARERSEAGWSGGLAYEDGALVFRLDDAEGAPVALDAVSIAVSRPIGVEGDRTVDLLQRADGRFVADIALEPGVWNAAIIASVPGEANYEHRARLVVQ